ncbi:MAG: hypothetical protein GY853_09700 [PVC group bacterium]|nr:hypothetical protein [PVC group bacterium]
MKKNEQISEINKKDINPESKNWFCKIFYLPTGEFSLTRTVMFISVFQSLIVLFAGLICSLFTYISIKEQVYDYSFKILALGIGQYTGSKVKNSFDNKIDKNIPKV